MNIEIRRARADEADLLTRLSMRSKQSNGYDDAFMEACRVELTVTAARMEEGEYWVAAADGILGCVCLVDDGDGSGEVHAFFIDPDHQRRGIGRRLWQKVVERARILGIERLSLDADPGAVPFYEALGFVTVGAAPSGSITGRSLPRMHIVLGA
ncbi:MAG: GNAT family N-acetyltransferase [Geminicoccaceae bacterium]